MSQAPQNSAPSRALGWCEEELKSFGWVMTLVVRSARGTRRDFPNREDVVRLHRRWCRPPGHFGSSTGRWHSPSRQCIQQDRIRGIRCAPEVEVFLFLELVQTGRIADPSRLSQPIPALSPRDEASLRQVIQICNCLCAAPWSS